MSSILKVDTIQDQNGNLIISKDSGGSGFLSPYASSSAAITYTVTVASKTTAHPYYGVGSSNGYFINGIESPIIEIKGNDTSKPYHYKFDQSDSSNSGHPLLFYNNVGKTTQFTTGVTTNGTPGQAGAYTMIAVDSQTPNILYYQCSSHANMGNHTFATSPVVNTGVFLTLPTADGSSGQFVTTNGSGVLSFANGSVPDDAITLAKMAPGTDGNIISYDASGNPVAVATGSAGQVLTSAGAGAPPTFAAAGVAGISSSADATAMTIDSNENIGIGVTDPGSYSAKELVVGKTGSEAGITIRSSSSTTSNIYFADGTSGAERYQGYVQYDHANSKMNLGTAATTQWALDSSGNFLPAATDHGIYLGVTSATASNLLDDYEEGSFTPAYAFESGGSVTMQGGGSTRGHYVKVGNLVHFQIYMATTAISSPSGNCTITGLPITTGDNSSSSAAIGLAYRYATDMTLRARLSQNGTTIQLWKNTTGSGNSTAVQGSDFSGGNAYNNLHVAGCYSTA